MAEAGDAYFLPEMRSLSPVLLLPIFSVGSGNSTEKVAQAASRTLQMIDGRFEVK